MDELALQQSQPPPEKTEKKRRRPPLACEQCRKRKIRCDRNSPCGHCVKANISNCTYAPTHVPAWRIKKASDLQAPATTSKTPSSMATKPQLRNIQPAPSTEPQASESEPIQPVSTTSNPVPLATSSPSVLSSNAGSTSGASTNVDWLVARVRELEEKLAKVLHIKEAHDVTNKHRAPQGMSEPAGGMIAKSRYFGQSHWAHGLNLFPIEYEIVGSDEVDQGDLYSSIAKCKVLGRKIKKNRLKPLSSTNLGTQIPTRDLADQLVEGYLRTFEGVFRVVHIPTFRTDYEKYWQNPATLDESFVILLQLCMALGATVHDNIFSLRAMATQWIHEAQMWLMLPPEKKRTNIEGIQISCLLLIAKSTCGIGQDMTWIMAGTLIRKAMFLGLHRDPKHLGNMTTYRAEMRRRLWATILELNIQFSFEAGGSPLVSTSHYDTQAPANLDDDELGDEKDGDTVGGEPDEPTQTSVQRALLATIPLRMNLINHINNTRPGDAYEETLRLNSDLTKACRALTQSLTALKNKPDSPVTSFHISLAEIPLYQCFHALHQPVIVRHLDDDRFYFSRKMCLDSALKLSHIWGLPEAWSPNTAASTVMDRDLKCLVTTGTGMFRNVASQAMMMVATELLYSKKGQSTSLGYLPTIGGADLHARLAASQAWNMERARAGETNTKGIIFLTACLAHVNALEAGLNSKDKVISILQAATEASRKCWEILKEVAERDGIPASAWEEEVIGMEGDSNLAMDWMQDWGWDDMQGMTWPQWNPEEEFMDDMALNAEAF